MNLLDEVKIENVIYEIRGKQVMLDSDSAKLYQCKNGTKTINLAVKRHINRFPERFMFQLTIEEYKNLKFQVETANKMKNIFQITKQEFTNLKFQSGTSSLNKYSGVRKLHYAFTKHGITYFKNVYNE